MRAYWWWHATRLYARARCDTSPRARSDEVLQGRKDLPHILDRSGDAWQMGTLSSRDDKHVKFVVFRLKGMRG